MITYGKWKIWADDEQWIMCDKPRFSKQGLPVPGANTYYFGSIESLFRRLYQQSIRDNSTDCKTLSEIVAIANVTAQELESVLRNTLEFLPAKNSQKEA